MKLGHVILGILKSLVFVMAVAFVAIGALGLSSCTKARSPAAAAQNPGSGGANPSGKVTPGEYSYPHAKDWKSSHVSYFANNQTAIEGTRQDCARCHKAQNWGPSLNVNCAMTCHAPSTSENRDRSGVPSVIVKPADPETIACIKCHQKNAPSGATAGHLHFPATAGLCLMCHTASADHLAGKVKDQTTTKGSPESCNQCHSQKDKEANVHSAIKMFENSCTQCHQVHGGTSARHFIKAARVNELCASCHGAHTGKSIHGAEQMGKDCVNCHSPHSSKNEKLLLAPTGDLCAKCHSKSIETQFAATKRVIPNIVAKVTGPYPHAVVSMGTCNQCHSPHAADNDRLLLFPYSISNYNLYSETTNNPYTLCLNCHGTDMLKQDKFDTKFRSDTMRTETTNPEVGKTDAAGTAGEVKTEVKVQKNLHWFHVVDATGTADKSQGRSCRICHDPHGSTQPFHLNESWSVNENKFPLVFQRATNGGTCTTSCHMNKSYQRIEPALAP